MFGLFFSPAGNKTAAALFFIPRKAPHLRAWKMLSFAYFSPMMQKGMNFPSYVGDFKAIMNYLNSDVNRYLHAVCSEAQIERYGFLFLSSALPNTAGDLDSDLREWHIFYNEFHRILQFKRPQQSANVFVTIKSVIAGGASLIRVNLHLNIQIFHF